VEPGFHFSFRTRDGSRETSNFRARSRHRPKVAATHPLRGPVRVTGRNDLPRSRVRRGGPKAEPGNARGQLAEGARNDVRTRVSHAEPPSATGGPSSAIRPVRLEGVVGSSLEPRNLRITLTRARAGQGRSKGRQVAHPGVPARVTSLTALFTALRRRLFSEARFRGEVAKMPERNSSADLPPDTDGLLAGWGLLLRCLSRHESRQHG
jgi:hypothetical protein